MEEREEPTIGKVDPADIKFRPRSYRGPTAPRRQEQEEFQTWKIGIAVCIAVFAALLLFNMYERHQDRKDAEMALRELRAETKRMEAESAREIAALNAQLWQQPAPRRTDRAYRPLADGERCMQGRRFQRVENGWVQLKDPC